MKRTRWLLLAGLVALGTAACSKTDTVTLEHPSGTVSLGQATPSAQSTSISTTPPRVGDVPSLAPASPSPHSMAGASGAIVTTPKGESVTLAFTAMDPYSFYAEGGTSSLSFVDGQGNALSLGGTLHKGTVKTSTDTTLSIAVVQPPLGPVTLTSGDGSCRVMITSATRSEISGSFTCPNIAASKRTTFDVVGTFSGTMPSGG